MRRQYYSPLSYSLTKLVLDGVLLRALPALSESLAWVTTPLLQAVRTRTGTAVKRALCLRRRGAPALPHRAAHISAAGQFQRVKRAPPLPPAPIYRCAATW